MSELGLNKDIIKKIELEIYNEADPDYKKIGTWIIDVMEGSEDPVEFVDLASDVGVLEKILPELSKLKGIPAGPVDYHREDCFEHTLMVLDEIYKLRGNDTKTLLMAVFHDLGKGNTPKDKLPKHYNHG